MDIDTRLEEKLKSTVFKYLKRGRTDWDIPHTLACVYWIKKLLEAERGSPKILVTAMYFHDVGGVDMFKEKYPDFKTQMKLKSEHMRRGAVLSEKILNRMGEFSLGEIRRIVLLVKTHDDLDKAKTSDEQLVFEADSLGQIDRERVKPTFSKSNYLRFLKHFRQRRVPKFKTKTGKYFLNKLLPKAQKYFVK